MTYYGAAPTPPRTRSFFEAVRAQLSASARLSTILGGADRIIMGDEDMTPFGSQDTPWGRVVVIEGMGPALSIPSEPGRRRTIPFSVRVDVHSPGGGYDYRIAMQAAQQEVFELLHGFRPELTDARIVGVVEQTDIVIGRGWDEQMDVYFETSGYRATLAPNGG